MLASADDLTVLLVELEWCQERVLLLQGHQPFIGAEIRADAWEAVEMKKSWMFLTLALWFVPAGLAEEERPLSVRLFDFEAGVEGWAGNPWGGGKCGAEAAGEAKFGQGCLRGWYADVEQGANVICPYLPAEAAWRKVPWGGLSFFLQGDGSAASLTLQLETDEKEHPTYSRSVPLEDAAWHRVYLPFHTFWNRGGQTFDPARLRRFYFGASGTHHFFVDEIRLEAPHREVPLTSVATVAVPWQDGALRLDGNLDDGCWQHAAAVEPFSVIDGSAAAKEQTHCRLFHDGARLYLAATLETADVKRLRATLTRHDSAVYTDDSFEIFIAGDDPEGGFYQFAVNPLGTMMELSSDRLLAFEHDWQAAAAVGENAWTVEASIALAPLLRQLGPGCTFGLNLCRENQVTGELSGWSPTGESFLRPARFGQAILLGQTPLTAFTPPAPPSQGGGLAPVWNDYGDGVYAARVDASSLRGQVEGLTLRATLQFGNERFEGEDIAGRDDLARRELFAPVQARLEQEGEARVQFALFVVSHDSGVRRQQPVAFYAFRYPVFLPVKEPAEPSPLPIVPSPKEVIASAGEFIVPRQVRVAIAGGQPVDERVTNLLVRELRRWYDVGAEVEKEAAGANIVLFNRDKGAAASPDAGLSSGLSDATLVADDKRLAARLDTLPAQGYVEIVTPAQVAIAAHDDAGLYYGVQTFLQNVELTPPGPPFARGGTASSPDSPRARCGTVVDWPSLPWRALSMSIPTSRWGHPNDAPVDVGFFCDFIERFVARRKFNAVVFLTREGVHYDSHPEISGPAAWSKADVRRVVETCRAHFIEPIPLVDSYGHADWLTLSHKDLWEDGDHLIACSSHPETFRILTDVYAELLEVFAPVRYFHLGLDEVWWRTLDVPPEQRCKLCADVPKWQLFADQVKRLHDWLQVRGVRAMMWSDVLLPSNGGRSGSRCLTFSARWAFCTRPRRRCSSRTPMAATSASTWPSG